MIEICGYQFINISTLIEEFSSPDVGTACTANVQMEVTTGPPLDK